MIVFSSSFSRRVYIRCALLCSESLRWESTVHNFTIPWYSLNCASSLSSSSLSYISSGISIWGIYVLLANANFYVDLLYLSSNLTYLMDMNRSYYYILICSSWFYGLLGSLIVYNFLTAPCYYCFNCFIYNFSLFMLPSNANLVSIVLDSSPSLIIVFLCYASYPSLLIADISF